MYVRMYVCMYVGRYFFDFSGFFFVLFCLSIVAEFNFDKGNAKNRFFGQRKY